MNIVTVLNIPIMYVIVRKTFCLTVNTDFVAKFNIDGFTLCLHG